MKKIVCLDNARWLCTCESSDRASMILSFPDCIPHYWEHHSDESALSTLRTTATMEERSICTNSLNRQPEEVGSAIIPLLCWGHNFWNFRARDQQHPIQLGGQLLSQGEKPCVTTIPNTSSTIKDLISKTDQTELNMFRGCIPPVSNPANSSE